MPAVIEALGRANFGDVLLGAVRGYVDAAHLSIFRFNDALVPTVLVAASRDGGTMARTAGQEFIRLALYKDDPLASVIRQRESDARPLVQVMTPSLAAEGGGRPRFYQSLGLTDRITILDRSRAGWISVNFYRLKGAARLAPAALEQIVLEAATLHALVSRHLELISPTLAGQGTPELLRSRLRMMDAGLTPRETEVCVLALHGATNAEIGAALGIEVSTVSTLRHRAYERLGVSNVVEIFLKCLTMGG